MDDNRSAIPARTGSVSGQNSSTIAQGFAKPSKKNRFVFTSHLSLLTIPITSLLLVAALDQADKQLLASSFPMLERTLGLNVQTLGYFSLFSNLSFALAMPLWGWALHTFGMGKVHDLLSVACIMWGTATIGIAMFGSNLYLQALFRIVNGGALSSIMPLSQAILAELVPSSMRGRAFGLMSVCERIAGTLAASSIIYFNNWQYPYYALGVFSIVMAYISHKFLDLAAATSATHRYTIVNNDSNDNDNHYNVKDNPSPSKETAAIPSTAKKMTMKQIIQRILKLPVFICLVAQGVFGGTPWDMMSFVLLLLDWRGFTKEQVVTIQFTVGVSGTVGSWLGGTLGDYFAMRYPIKGRIYVALTSVAAHIPVYGMFLYSTTYSSAIFWYNLFYLTGTWSQAAAIRPICAELAQNPSERAQIVSMWVLLEKTSAAVLGAPLAGYFTGLMISNHDDAEVEQSVNGYNNNVVEQKASSLAFCLFSLSSLFWGVCAIVWAIMAFNSKIERQLIGAKNIPFVP